TLALLGWQKLPAGHPWRRPWQVAAVGVALLVLVKVPGEATRLGDMSDRVAFQHTAGVSALQAVSPSGCRSLAVSGTHVVPLLAVAHDLPATRFPVIKHHPPARSGYLVATTGETVRGFLLIPRIPRPAPGTRVAATAGDWRVYGRCPARD